MAPGVENEDYPDEVEARYEDTHSFSCCDLNSLKYCDASLQIAERRIQNLEEKYAISV